MAALGAKGAPGSGKGLKDASGISETEGGLEAGDAGGQSRSGARIGGLEAPSGISEPKAGLEADRLIARCSIKLAGVVVNTKYLSSVTQVSLEHHCSSVMDVALA